MAGLGSGEVSPRKSLAIAGEGHFLVPLEQYCSVEGILLDQRYKEMIRLSMIKNT